MRNKEIFICGFSASDLNLIIDFLLIKQKTKRSKHNDSMIIKTVVLVNFSFLKFISDLILTELYFHNIKSQICRRNLHE